MKLITSVSPAIDSLGGLFGVNSEGDRIQISPVWYWSAVASSIISGYHGSKRHDGSVWQTIKWSTLGGLFPIITPLVAVGQGFAKPMASKDVKGLRGALPRGLKKFKVDLVDAYTGDVVRSKEIVAPDAASAKRKFMHQHGMKHQIGTRIKSSPLGSSARRKGR